MQEQTFLDEGGCLVTNARFSHAGQTYAMANVTSVKAAQDGMALALILFLVGIPCLLAQSWVLVLFTFGLGGLLIYFRKTYVVLHTAGAEQRALSSRDGAFIGRVIAAVNNAIVHRG